MHLFSARRRPDPFRSEARDARARPGPPSEAPTEGARLDGAAPQNEQARPATPNHRFPCPRCNATAGFLIDADGFTYRVLEDDHDTEFLDEQLQDATASITVTCLACKAALDGALLLERAREHHSDAMHHADHPDVTIGTGHTKNRFHVAGHAKLRVTPDGRTLPGCPECGATHDFFVDLDGAAYRVLEDDQDTELLDEATNLLCGRCSAVFDL